MKPVRVAMIGAGKMAREHARAFADVPGATLAGIYSRTRAKAEALAAEFSFTTAASSIDELYRSTGADLVVVAVNVLDMFAVAMETLRYPWTILLEKPAGADLGEAEELATAAATHGRVYVALNRRMYAATRTALQDVAERDEFRYIRVCDQQDQAAGAAMGHPPRVVETWMFGNSIHLVDYLRLFGRGAVQSVERIVPWKPSAPGLVLAKVVFDSGDFGVYEGIWNGPGPWSAMIHTATRRWEMRPLERAVYQNRGERMLNEVQPAAWDIDFKAGFRRQAEEAVAAARRMPTELPSIADSLESMKLVAAIFEETK